MEPTPQEPGPRVVRWIVGGALLGALGAGMLYVGLVFQQTSSTAAIALYAVPLVAGLAGACGAVLGWSVYQVLHERPWPAGGTRRWVPWLVALTVLAGAVAAVVPQVVRIAAFHSLQQEGVSPRTLERSAENALRSRDYFLLSAVARNPSAPPELLLELARSDDPGLHEKRAGMIQLFDRDSLAVVRKVLRNPSTPAEAIPLLARSTNAYVLGDLAGHAGTPEPILRQIYGRSDGYLVHWGLARNPGTPPEILAEIAEKTDLMGTWIVASNLAGNPATPPPLLERLAAHEHHTVRYGLAGNPSISRALMEEMSTDPERRIRVHLTQNEAIGLDLVERLAADPDEYVRRYAGFAFGRIGASPSTPPQVVRRMATHADKLVRREAARNPNLDRDLAARLAADPESTVRYYLASNEHLDRDLLELLARDRSRSVRAEAAKLLGEEPANGR